MLWGGKLLVETILRQTRTPSSVHSEKWDKLPQQLLDNVVQKLNRRFPASRARNKLKLALYRTHFRNCEVKNNHRIKLKNSKEFHKEFKEIRREIRLLEEQMQLKKKNSDYLHIGELLPLTLMTVKIRKKAQYKKEIGVNIL
ncbi:hypothetical protein TNCV_663811 [Trichonephila clavipes]|nr:hypothetical protein TNCV_663811 [Trichonephila clavipes]